MAKFGGGGVGENAKLADGVNRRLQNVARVDAVIIFHAINEELIGLWPQSIHRISLPGAQRTSGIPEALCHRSHAGLQ